MMKWWISARRGIWRCVMVDCALAVFVGTGLLIGAGAARGDEPRGKADFVYIDRGDVSTLDLNRMSWMQDIRVAWGLWEGLYAMDPVTLKCIPGVADRVKVSDDQTVWTFHIRPDARWSNGDRVTSGDFVFAWRRMLEQPGDYTYLHHYIRGAQAYEAAFAKDPKSADYKTVGVETPDDATLVVKLIHPVTFFPDLCAFTPFFPMHGKSMQPFRQVDGKSGLVSYDEKFTQPPNLVTDGAFKLTWWQVGVGLRMEANPFYWDKAHVKSRSIEMVVCTDQLTALNKYDAGDVDWWAEPISQICADLREKGRKDLHICNSFGTYFYSFNCLPMLPGNRPNPLTDIRVRQALSMAVDKQPIVDSILRCGEQVARDYVPPGVFEGYVSPPGLAYDVKAARHLMKEAGYPGGKGFPRLTLLYNTEGDHKPVAEYVAKQWEDNLNLHFETEGLEIAQFREKLHNKEYDVARASWYGDYNDISTFSDKYLSNSDNNDSGWANAEYDKLCNDAAFEIDPLKRTGMLCKAEGILLNDAPIMPVYYYTNRWLYRDNVTGLYLSPRDIALFKWVSAGR
jgi:oligopeptide transport system substrate-binding protein